MTLSLNPPTEEGLTLRGCALLSAAYTRRVRFCLRHNVNLVNIGVHFIAMSNGASIIEADLIEQEWRREYDVGNLPRLPLMMREND